jgi:hypothetical protein
MLATEPAVLAELKLVGRILLVFRGGIVPLLALGARQGDDITHSRIP